LAPALVYLHGFRSSSRSAKAQLFVRAVAALPGEIRPQLHVPDLPLDPADAVAGVAAWIEREFPGGDAATRLTLIGSSLGGFYATHLAERFGARAALINPTVRPWADLVPYIGPQANLYTGESFEVTAAHLDALRALAVARITRPERLFLLVRSGDEVLPWRDAVAFYAGARQYVRGGGDHGWTDFAQEIPAVLRFAGLRVE
jgi:predicted esterase YcpF (UPF0227 family)